MDHQGDLPVAGGTHRSETERKRRYRARHRAAILFARDDWQLFLDPATLPQKAGCQPEMLRRIILRELVDNALDAGAAVTLDHDGEDAWIVADDGPGIALADVPRLFAVNRPLLSSKRRGLPLRGMLGNGLRVVMGGVAASGGEIHRHHARAPPQPRRGSGNRHNAGEHEARGLASRADRASGIRT